MDVPASLDELEQRIRDALLDPAKLFGADPPAGLRRLQIFCHPDKHEDKIKATQLFSRLAQLYEEVQAPPVILPSKKRKYKVTGRYDIGDVADILRATCDGKEYVLKVSRLVQGYRILQREEEVLQRLRNDMPEGSTLRYYLPELIESVSIRDKIQKRINIFSFDEELLPLRRIRAVHPDGIEARHSIWIFKRLMTVLELAHRLGIVHGAINPDHVLVGRANHQVQLVGWGQSVKTGTPLAFYPKKYSADYPPVVQRKRPTGCADVHLTAATILNNFKFKQSEQRLRQFFVGCMIPGMWQQNVMVRVLYEELDKLAEALYGAPTFVEL